LIDKRRGLSSFEDNRVRATSDPGAVLLVHWTQHINVAREATNREIAMKKLLCISIVLSVAIAALILFASPVSAADAPAANKVYELRIYKTEPGKLDALHARFRDYTCKLFKKHGIEVIGFWTPAEGDEAKTTLIYIVAFPSVEAQKAAWQAFRADPEWAKAKAESEKEGALAKDVQSKNLKPTDYSPMR
jgi:hypothetical protein